MAKRRYEVDPRILSLFFFVAIPFVAFGALVVISLARVELQDAMGSHLEQRAVEARQLVERYVLDQYAHLHVLSLTALVDLFRAHGFAIETSWGAGYHPFPQRVARGLARLDPRHAHFIAVVARA